MQRPARYLDHLCCVRGRNLGGVEGGLPTDAWYFQLSIQAPAGELLDGASPGQWNVIYTSEQVQATCNPDWASFAWDFSSVKEAALLQEVSNIQLCVYANTQQPSQSDRPTPGRVPFRHNRGVLPAPDGHSAQRLHVTTPATSKQSVQHQGSVGTDLHDSDKQQQQMLACTAEVNLNDLVAIQGTLAALDVCLPPNTLVLELKEGFCLFPSLQLQSDSLQLAADSQQATSVAPLADEPNLPMHEAGQVFLRQFNVFLTCTLVSTIMCVTMHETAA